MGRIVESRQGDGLHSTLPQQGSSIWTDGQSWEQVICQSECPWPRPLVHLSQRSGRFPQPCVKAGTKPTNSLALMLCALLKKVFQFFLFLCLSREQSVLTATGCHGEARLALDWVMDCLGSQWFVMILHIHTEATRRGTKTKIHAICMCVSVQAVCFISRQTVRETTSVTSYFTHCFPFDPEARRVGHFDSKLDTGDQSSAIMTLLPSERAQEQLVH